MDDCEQQLLHELRHSEAKIFATMTTNISPTKRGPTSDASSTAGSESTASNASHFRRMSAAAPMPQIGGGMPSNPMEALHSSLLSGKFSDLTIIHGTREWKAHKVVVCSQSPVLESQISALDVSKTLDVSTHDYTSVCLLMKYLYTTKYNLDVSPPLCGLNILVPFYALSTTLQIPTLSSLIIQQFRFILHDRISDINIFFQLIRQIYSNAPSTPQLTGLREVVVEASVNEMRGLLSDKWKGGFLDLMGDTEEFWCDVLMFGSARREEKEVEVLVEECVVCDECGPRNEGEGYVIPVKCEGCGEEKHVEMR